MLYEYPDEFIVAVTYVDILDKDEVNKTLEDIYSSNCNESYNSLFSKESIDNDLYTNKNQRGFCKDKRKKFQKYISFKDDEFIIGVLRNVEDDIFKEFIDCELINAKDIKTYLINLNVYNEFDNDYACFEVKKK